MGPGGEVGRPRVPPRGPTVFLAVMLTLAIASIVTGVVDVVVPALRGEEAFTALNAIVDVLGPGYLLVHVFVHNLGLACLVPGVGLVAARFERSRRNRRLVALILFTSVVLSLVVAVEYLVQARDRFRLEVVLPLVLLEGVAVLALAWRGYLVVRDFLPTPRVGWSLVPVSRELAPWFAASAVLLGVGALVETAIVMGAVA